MRQMVTKDIAGGGGKHSITTRLVGSRGDIGQCRRTETDKIRRTMKSRLVLPLLVLLLLPAGGAVAEGWRRELPPDERREIRQQMREQWQQRERLAPPQRAYDDGRPPRGRDFPPDERRRLRDEMREQHERDDRRGKRHRHDD